jgi:hypothetical protein
MPSHRVTDPCLPVAIRREHWIKRNKMGHNLAHRDELISGKNPGRYEMQYNDSGEFSSDESSAIPMWQAVILPTGGFGKCAR